MTSKPHPLVCALFHPLPCSKMWEYLNHVGDLLNNIRIALHAIPASEAALVRHSLSSASRAYSFTDSPIGKKKRALSRRKSVPYVTGEDGRLLPGVCV